MSVWHFLMHNEKGAIFRLLPKSLRDQGTKTPGNTSSATGTYSKKEGNEDQTKEGENF